MPAPASATSRPGAGPPVRELWWRNRSTRDPLAWRAWRGVLAPEVVPRVPRPLWIMPVLAGINLLLASILFAASGSWMLIGVLGLSWIQAIIIPALRATSELRRIEAEDLLTHLYVTPVTAAQVVRPLIAAITAETALLVGAQVFALYLYAPFREAILQFRDFRPEVTGRFIAYSMLVPLFAWYGAVTATMVFFVSREFLRGAGALVIAAAIPVLGSSFALVFISPIEIGGPWGRTLASGLADIVALGSVALLFQGWMHSTMAADRFWAPVSGE